MIKFPTKARIGPHDFNIKFVDEINGGQHIGQYSHSSLKLIIDKTAQPTKIGETLIHELNHGVHDIHCGIDLGQVFEYNEEQLNWLESMGWAQIMRDNPEVIRFILKCLHQKP